MTRLAEFVLRHRLLVVIAWLVAMVAGGATSATTVERLTVDFSLPGQPGYQAEKALLETYGNGPDEGSTLITITAPAGSTIDAGGRGKVDTLFRDFQSTFPQYRVIDGQNTGSDAFRTTDGRTAYGLVLEKKFTSFEQKPAFREAQEFLAEQEAKTGFDIRTTGYYELAEGNAESSEGGEPPSLLAETLFGAAGALVVLLFVFASFMALVPLLIAAVSILSTFLCVLALSYLTDMSFVVQFLIALVGLGVAIDYSLLIVTRWREEREHGKDNHAAVVESVRTAGKAVLASGATVAVSLIALIVVPVPFLRSMGIGGMLIPLVSTAVVLTFLPAMLGSIGPRVDWPRIRHENRASRAWSGWARMISRRSWLAAGAGLLILGLLIAPVFGIKIGQARTESLAVQGPAVEALADLRAGGVPAGIITPLEVLVQGSGADAGAAEVARRLDGVDGVAFAAVPKDIAWAKAGSAVVLVVPVAEIVDTQAAGVVERIRNAIDGVPGVVGVAGPGATVLDYKDAVFAKFPLVMVLIALVTFLLLVRTFRSLLLPLKAVLLNIASVAATFGFVVLFWQRGYGSEQVFDISATGAIAFWLPVLIFAFLFGLSMDYEVFILARMREEYDKTGSTRTAVIEGLGRTGRLVTCAALILFMAFIALATSPGTDVKVLATALGMGILIDATIVRALMVPALVSVLGKYNWWLPSWLAKPLRVEPSPLVTDIIPAQREPEGATTRV
ncbi:MAG TPA: MMPL family transporter [Mycobacteriales bacterium]|nr:MMPL family transporter [Mycobacteriales bacterium]